MRQNSPHPSSALPGRPSRRGFLQGVAAGTVGLAAARLLSSLPVQAAGRQDNGVLILFFSHSGHTRQLAGMIHDRVGGRLVEIRPATPYPGDYDSVVDMARQEQRRKARPGLAGPLPDLTGCGTVFIGFPNWWDTMPMILFTLLEKLDLGNRTVIPFCTHGGSRFGRSIDDLARLCPQARILKGFEVRGTRVAGAGQAVDAWLRGLGLPLDGGSEAAAT